MVQPSHMCKPCFVLSSALKFLVLESKYYLALKTKLYLLSAHIAKMLRQLSHVFQYVPFIPNIQGSETVPTNRAYMSQESSLTNKDIVYLLQQLGINICFVHVLKWKYFQNYRS